MELQSVRHACFEFESDQIGVAKNKEAKAKANLDESMQTKNVGFLLPTNAKKGVEFVLCCFGLLRVKLKFVFRKKFCNTVEARSINAFSSFLP